MLLTNIDREDVSKETEETWREGTSYSGVPGRSGSKCEALKSRLKQQRKLV